MGTMLSGTCDLFAGQMGALMGPLCGAVAGLLLVLTPGLLLIVVGAVSMVVGRKRRRRSL